MDNSNKDLAWNLFKSTGDIKAYLQYKGHEMAENAISIGENYGIDEDDRDSNKGDKL